MASQFWAEPGLSQGRYKADGVDATTFPVLSGGVLCGSVPAELGQCNADIVIEGDSAEFVQRVAVEPGQCKAHVAAASGSAKFVQGAAPGSVGSEYLGNL